MRFRRKPFARYFRFGHNDLNDLQKAPANRPGLFVLAALAGFAIHAGAASRRFVVAQRQRAGVLNGM
jgi:hypothetical protein